MDTSTPNGSKVERRFFRTPAQARQLAHEFTRHLPQPAKVEVGLFELLMNAVEHGNLGISASEKQKLMSEDRFVAELEARLSDPRFENRQACLEVTRTAFSVIFSIKDDGEGFDWRGYVADGGPSGASSLESGRGIMIARKVGFERVEYVDPGNQVIATALLQPED